MEMPSEITKILSFVVYIFNSNLSKAMIVQKRFSFIGQRHIMV